MNKLFLSHITALKCLRELRYSPAYNDGYNKFDFSVSRISLGKKQITSYRDISYMDIPFYCIDQNTACMDILITNQKSRYITKNLNFHVCSYSLPKNLFIEIDKELAITGPELLYFQLAQVLDFEELIMLGNELCGTYVVCKDESYDFNCSNKGFIDHCPPATTLARLRRLAVIFEQKNKTKGCIIKNLHQAKKALKCVGDCSASPRESIVYSLLVGTRSQGMFNVGPLEMNKKIILSDEAKLIAGQNYVIVDICSTKYKLAIEYDSRMFHEEVSRGQKDKQRSDALSYDGWKVISIVPDHLRNSETFYNIAMYILRNMGKSTKITFSNFDNKYSSTFNKLTKMDMENFNQ
ncbi:MAG: DUF559 domain-containing protein [Coriobacteriia bacterium]|nr:DUF559 domain-containing protein [Coriobacteriia bacterium]